MSIITQLLGPIASLIIRIGVEYESEKDDNGRLSDYQIHAHSTNLQRPIAYPNIVGDGEDDVIHQKTKASLMLYWIDSEHVPDEKKIELIDKVLNM